ncbi:MAG TPA: glycosyltransferase family 4 protein, partial [Mycobacterium sp.]|nr:glycosyltransferase family 4 protein [Mycobacterium sp.]
LLEACRALGGRVELTLVGRVFPEMRKLMRETEANVTHIPHVPNSDLAAMVARHDAFVLASVQDGSAMAVTEAMAVGRPVVVSESVGAREFVAHGTGLVVPARSASALVEALERLLEERHQLPAMGAAARAAVEELTWERYGEQMAAVYERLTG